MQIYYLEIVTTDVDATCELYARLHRTATWSDPDPSLGGARTATTKGGSLVGVRAPMHDGEKAVTRAYTLVEDIRAAVESLESSEGAVIAVPPMEIPGRGWCAIYFLGGIEAGLWQL